MVADSTGTFKDVILICDGTLWRSAGFTATEPLEYSSATNPYVVVSNDTLGSVGVLDGTYSNYPTQSLGMIGVTPTGKNFIGAFNSNNAIFSGLWSQGYEMHFGQTYSADNLSSFSGLHMRDQSRIEFQYYGTPVMAMSDGRVAVGDSSNTANGRNFELRKSRGLNVVQTGDQLGSIAFVGRYATSSVDFLRTNFGTNPAALIRATVAPGTIDATLPAKLTFHTTPSSGSIAERMVISSEGFVGIGDPTPSVALDVVGDINYTGVIQDVSDKRLKENIKALNGSLERILTLNGYSFTMKDDDAAVVEYGLMAQDVETVFPELVRTKEDGFKTLNYIGLIGPLIEATKAQHQLIEEQQVHIKKLESRLQALEAK